MRKGYSVVQIRLHWVITGLVAVQCMLGPRMAAAWAAHVADPALQDAAIEIMHFALGVLILALTLWRIALRFTRGVPALPRQDNRVLKIGASISQGALLSAVVLMALTGLAAWLEIEAASALHRAVQVVLYALVGSHIAAGLMHQFVFRDGLLTRILRPEP